MERSKFLIALIAMVVTPFASFSKEKRLWKNKNIEYQHLTLICKNKDQFFRMGLFEIKREHGKIKALAKHYFANGKSHLSGQDLLYAITQDGKVHWITNINTECGFVHFIEMTE